MLVLAPFGAFAVPVAITAAICMGREAHEDTARALHRRRVLRGMYVLIGCLARRSPGC
jgi:predicted benzoate:H+ symporter BenE